MANEKLPLMYRQGEFFIGFFAFGSYVISLYLQILSLGGYLIFSP